MRETNLCRHPRRTYSGIWSSGAKNCSTRFFGAPRIRQSQEFLQAADEVLAEMSKLISLPILSPLKKASAPGKKFEPTSCRK